MSGPATASRSRRPRRRPFGVLAICALLIFQAAVLSLAVIALAAESSTGNSGDVLLRVFGIDLAFTGDQASMQKVAMAVLGALALFTFLQVVLLLALKRIGWVLTMLLVGGSLAAQLYAIWRGQPTNTLSLLIDAITALYLNQSEVRRAFGVSAGRIDAALGRSADAVVGAALGDPAMGDEA